MHDTDSVTVFTLLALSLTLVFLYILILDIVFVPGLDLLPFRSLSLLSMFFMSRSVAFFSSTPCCGLTAAWLATSGVALAVRF